MAQGVPLIVQETKGKQSTREIKKELPGNDKKTQKDGKTSFSAIFEKAGKEGKFLESNTGEIRLLRFISQIIKSIHAKLPAPLKNNLLNFVKNLVRQKGFSEKEKGDLLSTLLQKLQKKNSFPASLADEITTLSALLEKDILDVTQKNKLLAGIRGLLDEKNSKAKGARTQDGLSKLVVIDLRKGKNLKQQGEVQEKALKFTGNGENGSNTQNVKIQEGSSDHAFYFSLKDGACSQEQTQTPQMVSSGHTGFDQQMMEKLKNSLQNDIVKHTKIILKENGNGEIRIVLKPESLGSIRMRVNLQNNHIDGRIFVENINIKEIVDQAMNNLNAAFKQEGFDSVSLKVSVGHGNGQEQQDGREQEPAEYTYAEAAEEFEKNLELLFDLNLDYSRVNLFI